MNRTTSPSWQIAIGILIAGGVLFLAFGGYLAPILGTLSQPVISAQEWISTRFSSLYDLLKSPQDAAAMLAENQQLKDENAQLRTRLVELESQLAETQYLYGLLDYARARPQNSYVAAAVIGRDPSPFLQYVIIDRGSDHGIRHGMPVVTQQGLVGRVDAVTPRASRVQLITDAGMAVNVRIQKQEFDAVVTGSVTGELVMEMIPQQAKVEPGALIITSGLGGDYPSATIVGEVISVRKSATTLFQTASVQPAVDFESLRSVLIIVNFIPLDYQSLIPPAP